MQKERILRVLVAVALGGTCITEPAAAEPSATPPASVNTPDDSTPPQYPPCDAEPDEASMQGAQGAFQAGNASFNEADYPRAIFFWEDAYRRDCTAHAMLKNLARAYELNDQYNHAINALQTYLERNPESGESEAISRRIDNLRRRQDEREAAAQRVEPTPAPKVHSEPEPKPKATNPLDQEEQFPEYYDDGASSNRSVVPLVVAGVGAATGILGGVMWGVAKKDESDAADACPVRDMCEDSEIVNAGNDAQDRQLVWGIVAGAGAAITLGGIIWYFAQPEPGADETAVILPNVAPGFAGLSVSGAF